jgi:hypothetical protein
LMKTSIVTSNGMYLTVSCLPKAAVITGSL